MDLGTERMIANHLNFKIDLEANIVGKIVVSILFEGQSILGRSFMVLHSRIAAREEGLVLHRRARSSNEKPTFSCTRLDTDRPSLLVAKVLR